MVLRDKVKKERFLYISKCIDKNVEKGAHILLVGKEAFDFFEMYGKGVYQYTGISKDQERVTELTTSNARFMLVEPEDFDTEDRQFDAILFLDVLSRLNNPKRVVEKYYSFLKKSGFVYVTVPNIACWSKKVKKGNWAVAKDETHVKLYDAKKWKYIFEMNSLVIEKSFTEGYLDPPYVKWLPKVLQEATYLFGILQFRSKLLFLVGGDKLHYILRKGKSGGRRNPDFLRKT